jgi:hypothetical protein
MIRKFIPGALALGLAATSSAQTPAAEPSAPAATEATTPAIEIPAKPKLDPAVIKTDSSYALGFRTGSTFGQQFGRFGVSAADLDEATFLKGRPWATCCKRAKRKRLRQTWRPARNFLRKTASAKA